jgi:hypothetical protein
VKFRNPQLRLPEILLKGGEFNRRLMPPGGKDMSKLKILGTTTEILFLVAMWIAISPRVQAQDDDQPLRITFSQAVQVPGHVLPAGTYIFQRRMEGFAADENLIQISNSDGTRIITFVQTVPVTRKNISEATEFTFARSPEGRPPALVAWSFPGSLGGHQFLYPKRTEQQVEKEPHMVVAANSHGEVAITKTAGD